MSRTLFGGSLDEVLCEQYERTVGKDNGVRFEELVLQIPADRHRSHYVKTKVRVHRYADGSCAVFHGSRRLASYGADGHLVEPDLQRFSIAHRDHGVGEWV